MFLGARIPVHVLLVLRFLGDFHVQDAVRL